jgi:nucleoid DNA-binding protein
MAGLIKKQNAELFAELSDRKVMKVMRVVFAQVGRQLDALKEGESVRVPGFGSFRMRRTEREKDGQKVTVARVAFKRAPARDEAGGGQRKRNPRRGAGQ